MQQQEIFTKLNEIFRDFFDDEAITVTRETCAGDIKGWDSLSHISLLVAVEDCFDMKFGMGEVVSMQNVGDMADIIEREAL